VRLWKFSLFLLAGSIIISTIFLIAGLPIFSLFLFVPHVPFLSSDRKKTRRYPACGWKTTGNERFCPYDATPLEDSGSIN
jgi:hypothetical protein